MEQAKSKVINLNSAAAATEKGNLAREKTRAEIEKLNFEASGDKKDKMTTKMMDDFHSRAERANTYGSLASTFETGFAGAKFEAWGNFLSKLNKNLPLNDEDRRVSAWWTKYQNQVNEIRNDLFGSALTATEKEEFAKAMITRSTDGKTAKKYLETQARILRKAYNNRLDSYSEHGWSVKGLEGQVIGSLDSEGDAGDPIVVPEGTWTVKRKPSMTLSTGVQ